MNKVIGIEDKRNHEKVRKILNYSSRIDSAILDMMNSGELSHDEVVALIGKRLGYIISILEKNPEKAEELRSIGCHFLKQDDEGSK